MDGLARVVWFRVGPVCGGHGAALFTLMALLAGAPVKCGGQPSFIQRVHRTPLGTRKPDSETWRKD